MVKPTLNLEWITTYLVTLSHKALTDLYVYEIIELIFSTHQRIK